MMRKNLPIQTPRTSVEPIVSGISSSIGLATTSASSPSSSPRYQHHKSMLLSSPQVYFKTIQRQRISPSSTPPILQHVQTSIHNRRHSDDDDDNNH